MVHQKSSIPTRDASSPARSLLPCSRTTASASAWTAEAELLITFLLNACGGVSSMSIFICILLVMESNFIRESANIYASTTARDCISHSTIELQNRCLKTQHKKTWISKYTLTFNETGPDSGEYHTTHMNTTLGRRLLVRSVFVIKAYYYRTQ